MGKKTPSGARKMDLSINDLYTQIRGLRYSESSKEDIFSKKLYSLLRNCPSLSCTMCKDEDIIHCKNCNGLGFIPTPVLKDTFNDLSFDYQKEFFSYSRFFNRISTQKYEFSIQGPKIEIELKYGWWNYEKYSFLISWTPGQNLNVESSQWSQVDLAFTADMILINNFSERFFCHDLNKKKNTNEECSFLQKFLCS